MSKMQISGRDRVKVRVQCLRLIVTLRLDPARSQLIAGFVRTYLQMTRPELVELQREVGLLPREEQNTMLKLTNEWIELGEEKGIERGRAVEARSLILFLGTKRFGAPNTTVEAILEQSDLIRLEAFVGRLLEVESWQELLAE